MGSSTNLYLPLHARNNDILHVLARIIGEPYRLETFDKQKTVSTRPFKTINVPVPFDAEEPSSVDNPWHVRFEREYTGLQISTVNSTDSSLNAIEFQDLAKNSYRWNFFLDYDQRDNDGLFVQRAKLLSPSSTAIAVACCTRLAKFFGGQVFFNDDKDSDEPNILIEDHQAKFPLMAKGTTSDDQWYAFQNAVHNEPLLTIAELDEARALAAYKDRERDDSFLRALRSHEKAQTLRQNLPAVDEEPNAKTSPTNIRRKARF